MSSSEVSAACRDLFAALARLRDAESTVSGQELADALKMRRMVHRQLDQDDLRIVDSLDQSGFFLSKNTRPGPGVMELTGCRKSAGTRAVQLAAALFPQSTISGQPAEPVLPATAAAFVELSIGLDHASVIRTALASSAAGRLDPEVWAAAERQLASWALEYRPDELAEMARRLIDGLDADGAEPDHELDNQTNELHLTRSSDGIGGYLKGRLDSVTFDALVQLIEAFIKSQAGTDKTRPERQGDALGELLERVLHYDDELPETGGNPPS
jgi:5-methylcytosine-specific restriction protein A